MQSSGLQEALGRASEHPVARRGDRSPVCILDLKENIARAAAIIQAKAEGPVVLFCDDALAFLSGFIACAHLQKELIIAPSEPALQSLMQSDAGYCSFSDIPTLSDQAAILFSFHQNVAHSPAVSIPELPTIDSDWSFFLYTSGSSGQPKKIVKTLLLLEEEVQELEQLWGHECENSTFAGTVSHQHIYGLLFRVLWPFCTGRTFAAELLRHPGQVQAYGELCGAMTLVSSPSFLKRLPEEIIHTTLAKCKALFSSGGALPRQSALSILRHRGIAPCEIFGSTETGGIAYRSALSDDEDSFWNFFPGVRASRNEDTTGPLVIRSPFIHPSLKDRCGAYESSDLVRFNEDRTFELLGRLDRVVKIEEKRVSLPEIEQMLHTFPQIEEAACIALDRKLPGGSIRKCVGAVIQLANNPQQQSSVLIKDIRSTLRGKLDPLAIPRHFRFVESLPENSQNKICTQSLRALFDDCPAEATEQIIIDEHLPQLQGHFPDNPIVPGFLQLDWLARTFSQFFPGHTFAELKQVKFLTPIVPRDTLSIAIDIKRKESSFLFTISSAQGTHSTGSIALQEDQ